MDYGGLNRLIGREVGEEFWGTRTQHIVGVAAALALTGKSALVLFCHMIIHVFNVKCKGLIIDI